MSDKIPLPEDTTEATETGMDQRKPTPLPHDAVKGGGDRPSPEHPAADEEHPISVGKP
ncbi:MULTISPECIES: hypothetical protein [Herbaspirillum]|uniref:hypothetical protein n=1 Tax=Herbaspirillum TaxID=963 RepID=UPI0012AD06AF|nr:MULTISPECIES: hypothetical protein [Herbaspirillum]